MKPDASAMSTPLGIGVTPVAEATTRSAKPPWEAPAMTASPTATLSTSGPTSLTIPATSPPGVNGSLGLNWYLSWMISTSGKFKPQACTSMTTCPGPALGSGTSSITNDSGGPNSLQTTAFMAGCLAAPPNAWER